jgi:hypothetical protein
VAVLLAAGCGGDEKPAAVVGDPLKELQAASVKSVSSSFHVTLSAPRVEAVGDVDPIGQQLTLDVTTRDDAGGAPVEQKIRVVGADAYLTLGKTRVRGIDPSKYIQFTAPSPAFTRASEVHLEDPYDPVGLKGLAFGYTTARRVSGGGLVGTLDLTKALYGTSRGLLPSDPAQLKRAGSAVKKIPYDAVVANGYLTSLTVKMPAYGSSPAYEARNTFSKFDDPVKVERPESSEITDVTEELRQILTD